MGGILGKALPDVNKNAASNTSMPQGLSKAKQIP